MAKPSQRNEYGRLFGPPPATASVSGDTGLFVEIDADLRGAPGDEIVFGGGKSLAKAWQWTTDHRAGGAPDLVITKRERSSTLLGVVKADVGIKTTHLASASPAPQVMDGITPGLEWRPRHRCDLLATT